MKNLREEDMFAELKERLEAYSEDPEGDCWDKISAALPPDKLFSGSVIMDHIVGSGMILFAMLQFLLTEPAFRKDHDGAAKTSLVIQSFTNDEKHITIPEGGKRPSESERVVPRLQNSAQHDHAVRRTQENARNNVMIPRAKEALLSPTLIEEPTSNEDKFHVIAGTNSFIDSVSNLLVREAVTPGNAGDKEEVADSTQRAKTKPRHETKKKKDDRKRFQARIYGSITTSLAYQDIVPLRHDDVTVSGLKPVSIVDPTRIGIQLDAGYQRQLLKRLEIYGGILYYRQRQRIGFYESGGASVTSADDLKFTLHPKEQARELDYFMQNIGVSGGVFYLIREGRLQHKAGAGLQYQAGLESANDTYNNRASTYLNYVLAYRLEIQVSNDAKFFVQPSFTHVMRANERLYEPFGIKSYRAGIGFGMLWKL